MGKMVRKGKGFLVCEAHEVVDSTHYLPLAELKLVQLCLAKNYLMDGLCKDTWYPVEKELYAQIFGLSNKEAYDALVAAALNLQTRTLVLKSTLLDPEQSDKSKTSINWLEACRYNTETASVELMWSAGLVQILNQLGADYPYSKYYLEDVCRLKSLNAMRLYRQVNKWLLKGKVTYKLEEFKRLLGLEPNEYSSFADLNKIIIKPSIIEINKSTNLEIAVSYKTLARKVSELTFTVSRKQVE